MGLVLSRRCPSKDGMPGRYKLLYSFWLSGMSRVSKVMGDIGSREGTDLLVRAIGGAECEHSY